MSDERRRSVASVQLGHALGQELGGDRVSDRTAAMLKEMREGRVGAAGGADALLLGKERRGGRSSERGRRGMEG